MLETHVGGEGVPLQNLYHLDGLVTHLNMRTDGIYY